MAQVVSGSAVALRLRDSRSPPDWSAEVLVGDPDDSIRARGDAAWSDGWWTAEVVVGGPPARLDSQWILRRDGTPHAVEGEAVDVLPGLLEADANKWLRDKADDKAWVRTALEAAREALAASAGSADLSIAVDGYSATFETRSDLLAFIGKLERRLRGGRLRQTVLAPC